MADQAFAVKTGFSGVSTIVFEGATDDAYETTLQATDPTADRTITLPDATGTVVLADGSGNVTLSGNLTVNGTTTTVNSTEVNIQNAFIFEGTTANDFETTLTVIDPTADRTITLPDVSGTVITTGDTSTVTNTMLAGSIANNKLANSSITINGSSVSLGGSATITTDPTPSVFMLMGA